ncbi:MAG: Yip1 family protein [Candidatus Hodarchaeales archaeon]|jgi:hypothetical protein
MSKSESLVCPNCTERSPGGYILCPYCGFDLTKIVRARERIRVTIKERFLRIWRSLFDPRESKRLFTEIGVNPDRLGAFLALYFLSVAYSFRLSALVLKTSNPESHDLPILFFPIAPWFLGIGFLLLALFGWLVASLVVWLIAKTLGGKAGFRDTLGIVGYSVGPLITASLIVNLLITVLGEPISTIGSSSWKLYSNFELIYIPAFLLVVYHCGNGIQASHLLSKPFSYLIPGIITTLFILLFLFPVVFWPYF